MTQVSLSDVVRRLSESQDRAALRRKLNLYRLNFARSNRRDGLVFIDSLDRILRIRR